MDRITVQTDRPHIPPLDRNGYSAGICDLIDTAERRGATDGEIRRLIREWQDAAIQRVTEGGQR